MAKDAKPTVAVASSLPSDLIWEIVRNNNAFLVKRKHSGGVQFSRDPYNLTNLHTRKHAGFVNEKAIGIAPVEKGGVTVISKKTGSAHRPGVASHSVTYHGGKSTRKTFKSVASSVAKSGYRPDLREAAVQRASAIRKSQRPVKPSPERKPRGNKAKKAAEES